MLILAVDDEPAVVEMIQEIVEGEGHACLTAGSVDDADWILRSVTVDVILLDFGMPGRRPIEWLEDLALADPDMGRRTIVITGYRLDDETLLRIRTCGSGLLQKPFRIDVMLDSIRTRGRSGSALPEPTPRPMRPRPPGKMKDPE